MLYPTHILARGYENIPVHEAWSLHLWTSSDDQILGWNYFPAELKKLFIKLKLLLCKKGISHHGVIWISLIEISFLI